MKRSKELKPYIIYYAQHNVPEGVKDLGLPLVSLRQASLVALRGLLVELLLYLRQVQLNATGLAVEVDEGRGVVEHRAHAGRHDPMLTCHLTPDTQQLHKHCFRRGLPII